MVRKKQKIPLLRLQMYRAVAPWSFRSSATLQIEYDRKLNGTRPYIKNIDHHFYGVKYFVNIFFKKETIAFSSFSD